MDSILDELRALRDALPAPGSAPVSMWERVKKTRGRAMSRRKRCIAVLDFETDPFDNVAQTEIWPFIAVLYSDEFEPIVIWEQDYNLFVEKLLAAIEGLPDAFTIYAHNGGKFDFMFLVHKLRGEVSFKGRGIMRATIGNHELRDSFHIIPERLANLKKDDFDYSKLLRGTRENYREDIIAYCISDCENLLYFIKKFVDKYGFKISVGAAAMAVLGRDYRVEKVTPFTDEFLRKFFIGGRVQCIQGAGYFSGDLKLYDVNSMYPHVMATYLHPIGSEYVRRQGKPNQFTFFLQIECDNNGALLARDENGELTSEINHGVFFTTIHEYNEAIRLGLLSNVRIIECVDCFKTSNFAKFVLPLYELRAEEKRRLEICSGAEYEQCKSEILFLKLILNNAYGKFAQNPRRYKEHFLTDPGKSPAPETLIDDYPWLPEYQGLDYWIWSRSSPSLRFNNVGTAASITGGARAILMRAIHSAKNPIYCDTDSLICEELRDHELHATNLGAWDLEKEISELIVNGKKLYAYRDKDWRENMPKKEKAKHETIRSKGSSDITWDEMLGMLHSQVIEKTNKGPTLTRRQKQYYLTRHIKRTAPLNASKLPARKETRA